MAKSIITGRRPTVLPACPDAGNAAHAQDYRCRELIRREPAGSFRNLPGIRVRPADGVICHPEGEAGRNPAWTAVRRQRPSYLSEARQSRPCERRPAEASLAQRSRRPCFATEAVGGCSRSRDHRMGGDRSPNRTVNCDRRNSHDESRRHNYPSARQGGRCSSRSCRFPRPSESSHPTSLTS